MKKHLLFFLAFTAGASTLYAQSGNVGIGTTTPGSKLTVNGSFAGAYKTLTGQFVVYTLTADDYCVVADPGISANITLPPAQTGAGNFKGRVYYVKHIGTNTNDLAVFAASGEAIHVDGGAAPGLPLVGVPAGETICLISNGNTSGVTWEVVSKSSSNSPRDYDWLKSDGTSPGAVSDLDSSIHHNGKVGIGTNTPQTKLDIQGSGLAADGQLAIGGEAPSIRLYGGSSLPSTIPTTFAVPYAKIGVATSNGHFLGTAAAGDLVIQNIDTNKSIIFSSNFGLGGIEQMRLNGKGNLGIGTTLPIAKLDVKGSHGSNFFRAADNNDTVRLLLSNGFLGTTALAVSPGDNSSRISLSASGVGGLNNSLSSTKHLYLTSQSGGLEFRSGSNSFTFAHNSTPVAGLWNGNLTIGIPYLVDTPYARLDVRTAASDTTKAMRIKNINNSELLTVRNNGRIGIGTADPRNYLHISQPGLTSNIGIGTSNFLVGQVITANDVAGGQNGPGMYLENLGNPIGQKVVKISYTSDTVGNGYLFFQSVGDDASGGPAIMSMHHSGNVGIGTIAPTAKLSVNGTANNITGTWGLFSDARIKTVDENFEDGLATVLKIRPVKFHYNANAPFKSEEQQIGIVAQEMEQIAPYMVSKIKAEGFDDLRQYNNQALPYLLVNAIQEQQKEIEKQQKKIEALEAENRKLAATVEHSEKSEKAYAELAQEVKEMQQMLGISKMTTGSKVAGK